MQGDDICVCAATKRLQRNAAHPSAQCRQCDRYWCCIHDCREEFTYLADLIRHQFLGHKQSVLRPLACGRCAAVQFPSTNFVDKFVMCQPCNRHLCTINGCGAHRASRVTLATHQARSHSDPYACNNCGAFKHRNTGVATTAQCTNCPFHHCLLGLCIFESVSPAGIIVHQARCRFRYP